jgi:hopanoid biosynthesis associated radical SAM protein HpnH
LFHGQSAQEVASFIDNVMALGVEGITISPGFSYEHAPQQEVFIQRQASKQLFRDIFRLGNKRGWRFNHSSLFLNFLAGNETYRCTPWGNPTRNVFGWQKPCYLLVDEGYAPTFKALMEETNWDRYGTGNNPKCANCMAHCGYEATAVNDAIGHPVKGLRVMLRGPQTEGPFAPELPITY